MGGMKRKAEESLGSGHKWMRGSKISEGGFGSVFVAFTKIPYIHSHHMPEAMAVKSAKMKDSGSIQYELKVYNDRKNRGGLCPFIIDHYGEEVTTSSKGEEVYNLALEVAWGSLARLIKNVGGGLPQRDVRRYTRDILQGIAYMHKCGYVHCDLKPENVLLVENEDEDVPRRIIAKVADLGLAKKKDKVHERWRGTPMYLAPETLRFNEQEEPSDIWALGCIVLEMITGEPARNHYYDEESNKIVVVDGVVPKIPEDEISGVAKDFLGCCLDNYMDRPTAKKLLSHPFVAKKYLHIDFT
uniref:mitogen-activated protein kinase kinase kinase 1-like n=1 Tax=Fragaria vesca subsp. vesca TaxID=101020 RepID=UPI0005C979DA|nr:PREDICTED: mitogen-activated protein kinase kinase kinase 1-like [Fragaria vesca subsp. vesca]